MLRFDQPWLLLLLLPVLGLVIWSFRHLHGMVRGRKIVAVVLRASLAALLVVALAGPQLRRENEGLCTIFVLDRSDSVREEDLKAAEAFVRDALGELRPEDLAGVVAFGGDASIDVAPGTTRTLGRVLTVVDRSASDLAGAIRLASAAFPDGKARRIVVLSDGNETRGDAVEAAQVAATQGIQIDFVPLAAESERAEVVVLETQVPADVPSGEPFDVRVVVDASKATTSRLVLDRDGVVVSDQRVALSEGRNVIVVSQRLDRPGFSKFRATLEADDDRDNRNNVGLGFTQVRGQPRVLVAVQSLQNRVLAQVLQSQGLKVDLVDPSTLPARAEEFQAYEAVIFNDINASQVTEGQMRLIQTAVRDTGVGFAMIGGENSFLPGGYYGSPIAEVLPVDLNIRQRKTFPSTTVLIVVDASGSMAMVENGQPKIRLAAKAAEQTVNLLSPVDRVGVAGSTDGIEFVAPIQELRDKGKVISQVRRLSTGGGGIYVRPSLEFAYGELRKEDTKVRHLILVADGADADMLEGTVALTTAAKREQITTTVVAIGNGKDVQALRLLAAAGGGNYYLAEQAGQLPAIFTQDAAIMSRSAIEEGVFRPKALAGEEAMRGIPGESVPALFAYCISEAKPLARVGMRTHKDDPLLAAMPYGLGNSLAFTSDAQPRWAAEWVGWGSFGRFWAQATRSILRRAATGGYELNSRFVDGRGEVELRATDSTGQPIDNLRPQVRVASPDGESRLVELSQTAPGTYSSRFDASELGTYIVAYAEESGQGAPIVTSGFSLPYPAEYRRVRPNRPLLERIAETTGGMALEQPAQAARMRDDPGYSLQSVAPWLILAAALVLPIDVAVRRVAIPVAQAWAWLLALARRRRAPKEQPQTIDRLRGAKKRVQENMPESEAIVVPTATPQDRPTQPRRSDPMGSVSSKLLDAKRKRKGE